MTLRFTVAVLFTALTPALAGQKEPKAAPHPPAPRQQQAAPRPQQQARPQQGRGNAGGAVPAPGIVNLQRLARMSPEERQKALANLPPARQQALMRQLQNFQQLPPAARQREVQQAEKLQSLPPQRRSQVRQSLVQFRDLPVERKAAISSELDRLNAMPEEDRRARMNSEEFRNRYSPAEQQMMSNISEVMPPPERP
jgi:phage-related protein